MAGKSPVTARDDQKAGLKALASGADRAEADRARAILLTLAGWTSGRIAEAFGVRGYRCGYGAAISSAAGSRLSKHASRQVRSRSRRRPRFGWPSRSCPRRSPIGPIGPWAAWPRRSPAARGDDLKIAALESSAPKRGFRFRRPRHTLKGRQDKDAVDRVVRPRTSPLTPAANVAVASRQDGRDDCGAAVLALARG